MSWSLVAVGKAPAVGAEITKQAARSKCSEPEETVRQAAVATIAAAIAAQDPSTVVRVDASGSQSEDYTTKVMRNTLRILVEPLYGFLE